MKAASRKVKKTRTEAQDSTRHSIGALIWYSIMSVCYIWVTYCFGRFDQYLAEEEKRIH